MVSSTPIVILLFLSMGSCATEQNVVHEVSSGACMLQKTSSNMFKANVSAHDLNEEDMLLLQEAAEHREWRLQHEVLQQARWASTEVFDEFLAGQASSSQACSARVLESKKQLDGLTARLDLLASQIDGQEGIRDTETQNLNSYKASMNASETKYQGDLAKCQGQKDEAKADFDRYTKEQEELDAIGAASEKHFQVSLLGDSDALDPQSCLALVEFLKRDGKLESGKVNRHQGGVGKGDEDKSCEEQREELQKDFTKAYDQIRKLIQSAKERTEDQTCEQTAETEKAGALSTLTPDRAKATQALNDANKEINRLTLNLESLKDMNTKLEAHIEQKLKPECDAADKVSETLQAVRDEIHSLEKCPKKKDWKLETPEMNVEPDEEPVWKTCASFTGDGTNKPNRLVPCYSAGNGQQFRVRVSTKSQQGPWISLGMVVFEDGGQRVSSISATCWNGWSGDRINDPSVYNLHLCGNDAHGKLEGIIMRNDQLEAGSSACKGSQCKMEWQYASEASADPAPPTPAPAWKTCASFTGDRTNNNDRLIPCYNAGNGRQFRVRVKAKSVDGPWISIGTVEFEEGGHRVSSISAPCWNGWSGRKVVDSPVYNLHLCSNDAHGNLKGIIMHNDQLEAGSSACKGHSCKMEWQYYASEAPADY